MKFFLMKKLLKGNEKLHDGNLKYPPLNRNKHLLKNLQKKCEVDISDGEMLKRLKKYCSPKTESSEPNVEEIADKVIDRLTQSMLGAIRSATCDIPQEDQE